MRKLLKSSLLMFAALALAVVPALAQDQEQEAEKDLSGYAGIYEFEEPSYGVIAVTIADWTTSSARLSSPLTRSMTNRNSRGN